MTYSKFAQGVEVGFPIPSRTAMLLFYAPAGLVAVYHLFSHHSAATSIIEDRTLLAAVLMLLHFGKRCLEVLFLHKFSGETPMMSVVFISVLYILASNSCVHYAASVAPFAAAGINETLRAVGLVLFVVGELGNLYHHHLLASLRKPGETGYKVPRGGGFEFVAAPHYMFELVSWLGVSLVTQHWIVNGFFIGMALYLADRARGQSEWNRTKLKDEYPASRGNMIPFVW